MLPETILQSDVLDILFDNRNKTYGAYPLRRQYNARLAKAIISVAAFTLLLALLLRIKGEGNNQKILTGLASDTVTFLLPPVNRPPAEKVKSVKPASSAKQVAQVKFVDKIEIVKTPVTDTIPTAKALDAAVVGDKNTTGKAAEPGDGNTGNTNTGAAAPATAKMALKEEGPVEDADVMPAFPGGNEAFQKFMQRNLVQPDDLEAGEKVVVMVRFVVEKDGTIAAATLLNSGRKDLDENVLRTVQKMPKWVPGMQHGNRVAVYFKLPVTFLAQEQ